MKSLEELREIRERMKGQVSLRSEDHTQTRVVVGMATCGIASGARPILAALAEAVQENNLDNVTVNQTGCIGLCQYEPIVEVIEPNKEKVTYVNMTVEKALEVVDLHLIKGEPVIKYTIGALQEGTARRK
ncbi:MAG: (2Fe-2S) ferredoxin domain-containing protein [Clostridiales bacterium]|jgi:NADP-reducing hydrogenase subunit HndB|nr:(2Fe-2S) ferredoxin domain-containing protein [Clostridiales bacterium]